MKESRVFCLSDVTLAYNGQSAVERLSGVFLESSLTAIVGPNGAGKSTLLKALAGLQKPRSGSIVRGPSKESIAYLPQNSEIDRSFPITVADLIALGAWRSTGAFGRVSAAQLDKVEAAIAMVGLEGHGGRLISALSAGQFQRALFARLIVQDAQAILLDEPFTGLDEATKDILTALVTDVWRKEGRTVIAVIHDLDDVRRFFPETLLLNRRQIAWGPTSAVLTPSNLDKMRSPFELPESRVISLAQRFEDAPQWQSIRP